MSHVKTPIKKMQFTPTDTQYYSRDYLSTQLKIDNTVPEITSLDNIYCLQSVTILVDYQFMPTLRRCAGCITMYSQRKGNTFVLLDCSPDKNSNDKYQ